MAENSIEWRPTWAAIIDVLGFSESLSKEHRDQLATAYQGALAVTKKPIRVVGTSSDEYGVDIKIFSDSVILIGRHSNQRPDLKNACMAVTINSLRVATSLIKYGLAVRGAISYGEVLIDSNRELYLGDAIVRAHRWEQAQQWAWLSVSPDSLEQFEIDGGYPGAVPYLTDVPIKTGSIRTISYNPFEPSVYVQEVDVVLMSTKLEHHLRSAFAGGRPDTILKWMNTAAYLSAFLDSPIQPSDRYKAKKVNEGNLVE